jgi:hypothetical protein
MGSKALGGPRHEGRSQSSELGSAQGQYFAVSADRRAWAPLRPFLFRAGSRLGWPADFPFAYPALLQLQPS